MEKLVTVKQMRERYGCSMATARKYLRQVNPHMENPLTAHEWAVEKWEQSRTVGQVEKVRIRRTEPGRSVTYVPRTR